ncbi:MAG TPA: SDR family oxidoreductase [Thermoanaerobaculia bacterium]|nr:SDR family oxidoreductase [Thermoanaerobaculia bacterium]
MRNPKHGKKPAKNQRQQKAPGVSQKMNPPPDYGEKSYRGSAKLKDLAAIVTGGDSGIGRAVAIAFAREGADVAIGYLSDKEEQDANETVRWIEDAGRRAIKMRFNVQRPAECKRFVEKAASEFGRLDILVNNAGYQQEQESILDITPEQLEGTFRTNIFGFFYMVQSALPHMKEGAVILNTGSVTALKGNASLLDYSATKGAIHVFTKSLAQSLAEKGIRVNCVAPGPVWTPLIPATFKSMKDVAKHGEGTFWERPAQPAEIAPSYVFLASADARYYSGEILAPTGSETTR